MLNVSLTKDNKKAEKKDDETGKNTSMSRDEIKEENLKDEKKLDIT
jgi:hypothetical protein